jgi:uncharacterized pyridoxamine 5'-phosphate oxidase family protein
VKEVYKFLSENSPFYVATIDGDKPKVRPFGFVMLHEGKLWLSTNNQKDVYKQLKANPYIEICTSKNRNDWLRVKGKAVFNATPTIKAKALEERPTLKKMYSSVDNPIWELFYIEEGEATFSNMAGDSRTVQF